MSTYKYFIAILCLVSVQAILERDRGVDEWYQENLGELHDVKFIEHASSTANNKEPSAMYAISRDGVLSLFDLNTQSFAWKRQLTEDPDELFHLKYLSRNLLVHSQHRAMVLNTRGHTNYEVDFAKLFGTDVYTSDQAPVAAFMDFEDKIYSVFAFGDQVAFYQGTTYMTTIKIEQGALAQQLLPEENSILVACLFQGGGQTLKTFRISMDSLTSEMIAETRDLPASSEWSHQLTANNLVITDATRVRILDVRSLKSAGDNLAQGPLQFSMNDDIMLSENSQLYDFATKQKQTLNVPDKKCHVRRFMTTENWGKAPNAAAALCPG
jgi:hypothetical protein